MILLKSCPKCLGATVTDRDRYGRFVSCLNCGWLRDLNEPLDNVARNPQVRPLRRPKQASGPAATPL